MSSSARADDDHESAAGAHHHSSSSLRHGDSRPAVIGSADTEIVEPPGHPEHEPPHDGADESSRADTLHPDTLHHNALDHTVHYHGLFSGYPNYYGFALTGPPVIVPPQTTAAVLRRPLVRVARVPRRYRFGGGVSVLSSSSPGDSSSDRVRGFSALLRGRGDALEVELEMGGESATWNTGASKRVGGALYLNVLHGRFLVPYVVAATGLQFAHDQERQLYVEGGAGLAHRMTRRVTLSADARLTTRRAPPPQTSRDRLLVTKPAPVSERGAGLALRLAAILYF